VSALGAGGMGEVYRARDPRLQRDVAIKVLPSSLTSDPDRLARFEREAQVLASLNHPNIAAIHHLEHAGDVPAIIMELVEGETLADRIARGPIPLEEALPIAKQIADALEAAHEQGIIHRDLKPANVKVRDDRTVKVLDFGLAKAVAVASTANRDASLSPTLASPALMTGVGVLLGTAAYMSPEQARGKVADKRSDIWAFGCVLYEMLTGTRPFQGEDVTDALAAILRGEADWAALPSSTPATIRKLLQRCLQKDPRQRLADIRDARFDIEDALAQPSITAAPVAEARSIERWKRVLPWALVTIMVVISLLLLVGPRRELSSDPAVARADLNLPPGVELFTLGGSTIAVSPDGRRVAFIGVAGGARQLYVRSLDGFEAVPLRGSDNASICFFSFDGRSIAFITADGVLRSLSLADGLVVSLTRADFYRGSWGSDDRIVFVRDGALWQIPASGAAPRQLLSLDAPRHETLQASPLVLPGANAVLFTSMTGTNADSVRIEALMLATGERRVIVQRGAYPFYLPSGHLLFYRDSELLGAAFDIAELQVTGSPKRVIENLPQGGLSPAPLADVSAAGTFVYASTAATSRLVWVSRQGTEQSLLDALRPYANPRLASDGNRVLVQAGDLWVQDLSRATFTRLTSGEVIPSGGGFPVWTPDGRRIVFRTVTGLRWLAVDGSGRGDAIAGTSPSDYPGSITPDGEQLLFVRLSPESSGDLYVASLRGDPQIRPILKTPTYEGSAKLSPDGRWIAYSSNESGQMEVYVRPFPGLERRWQVSTQGGTQPVWNSNGKELFYRSVNKMMVVVVEASAAPDLKLSQPRPLFEQQYAFGSGITIPNYDVSPDGQRFVMIKDESSASRLNLVLNWSEELKRLVPTK
jgi:serine/threonine-protein kinase